MAIKTEWNLGLFYTSENDPQIEKDLAVTERAYIQFEKKYKNKTDYLKNENKLLEALIEYEHLINVTGSMKPSMYFYFARDLNSTNKKAEGEINKIDSRITKAGNRILFFHLNLGKIPGPAQKKFLKSKKLAHFRYCLELIFKESKYQLSESEEKIMNLKSPPSYNLWVSGVEKTLSKKTVEFKNKTLSLPEAQNLIPTLSITDRRVLYSKVLEKLKEIGDFSESEINAIYTNKKINDELRCFKESYEATLLGHETDEKTVLGLVDTVTKNFSISHRFYKLKAKLMGVETLEYSDRSALVGKNEKEVSVLDGIQIALRAFEAVDPKYANYIKSYFNNGQIDVYPKVGKRGGAYCWGGLNRPTFVLLNSVPKIDSVMTLGHEMGHAIHGELSKKQSPLYQGHSIAVAEVASTLFENFVFDEVFKTLTEKEQIIALHDKIQDDVQTIFRQIACFNFEYELHKLIRKQGSASQEEIAKLMNKNMQAYLGPLFKLSPDDGYQFVSWTHIRRFFYVYSYSYGQLISKALYVNYKKDKKFLIKIEEFLSAGCSKSPYQIFKDIGIDTSKPEFFANGLKSIEADIERLEQLTKGKKLI